MYYKLNNNDVVDARNEQPLELLASVGEFTYYYTEEKLKKPFIKVEEEDVPFGEGLDFTMRKDILVSRAKEGINLDFTSDALGSEHKYDLQSEQDQLNLTQALLFLQINSGLMKASPTVNIRCVDSNGVKDNRPHTKKQLEKLFSDWYIYKSNMLDKFSSLKVNVKTNNPLELKKLEEEHN